MLTCNTKHTIVLYLFNLHFYVFLIASFVSLMLLTIKSHDQKYCIILCILMNIIDTLELKTLNHKQQLSLYKVSTVNNKLNRFLEWRKCYITYVMCSRDFPDMSVLALLLRTYQTNPACPCYIYNFPYGNFWL